MRQSNGDWLRALMLNHKYKECEKKLTQYSKTPGKYVIADTRKSQQSDTKW